MSEEHKLFIKKLKIEKFKVAFFRVFILVFLIFIWEIAANLKWIDPFLFSSPSIISG